MTKSRALLSDLGVLFAMLLGLGLALWTGYAGAARILPYLCASQQPPPAQGEERP